jgi:predicted hydrocarbon binding protein
MVENGIANAIFRRALLSAKKVIGEEDLNAVLYAAGLSRFVKNIPDDDIKIGISAEEYARFNTAMEERYGRGGQFVLKRIGHEMFRSVIRDQAALLGLAGITLKLMPSQQRINFVLNSMANAFKDTNPKLESQVEQYEGHPSYTEHHCPICMGRKSDHPVCHLQVGELEEAVSWAVGDAFDVREIECIAKGDSVCRFIVFEKS